MKVSLEQIDELRSRVNVSYEEAKRTLEKNEGDLIKSIIELEKKKGKKIEYKGNVTSFTNKLLALKMLVKDKDGRILIDLPLVLIILTFLMAFWVVILGFILAVCTSCKIKVYRDSNSLNVDSIKQNMKATVDKIKVKSEEIIQDDEVVINKADDDTSSNEIIIE